MGQGYRDAERGEPGESPSGAGPSPGPSPGPSSGPSPGPSPRDHGRVAADRPLARTGAAPPRYAFRAGLTPHPDRVPGIHVPALAGLLAGGEEAGRTARRLVGDAPAAGDDELAAADVAAIRLGADLHDGGWWWEAHEAWEVPWKRWGRLEPRARLLQALVQDAAAFLQRERGREAGVVRLRRRAAANRGAALTVAPARGSWLGLDHADRERAMAAWAAGRRGGPDAFPRLPAGFGEQR